MSRGGCVGVRRARDERGASALELVLYMPLLMLFILIAVQFTLVYLGNATADAIARQTARVVRATNNPAQGMTKGMEYGRNISKGTLNGMHISIGYVQGGDAVQVTVRGHAQELVRWLVPEVSQTVTGPIEKLRPQP